MKKQSCRMTKQERDDHKEAVKYRKKSDQELVSEIRSLKQRAEKAETERDAMAALAEEEKHEKETAQRAADAAIEDAKKKVEELTGRAQKSGQTAGRDAVSLFLDKLLGMAGTGNGIGRGTVFKLRKVLETIPDEDFNCGTSET